MCLLVDVAVGCSGTGCESAFPGRMETQKADKIGRGKVDGVGSHAVQPGLRTSASSSR